MDNFRELYRQQRDKINRRFEEYRIDLTLEPERIEKVRAHIHRMDFSSPWDYPRIVDVIGPMKLLKDFRKNPKVVYGHQYIKNFDDFRVKVLVNRKSNFVPHSYWNIVPKGDITLKNQKAFLQNLSDSIPLSPSKCEYAVDLHTGNPSDARKLFFTMRRYLRTPRIKQSTTYHIS